MPSTALAGARVLPDYVALTKPLGQTITVLDGCPAIMDTAHVIHSFFRGAPIGAGLDSPLLADLDCLVPGGRMALAGLRRSGNAGGDIPTDHIAVLDDALEQLSRETAADAEIGVRADSAGATHELLGHCGEVRIAFSLGYDLTVAVREAILAVNHADWQPGRRARWRQVAEIMGLLGLAAWPQDRCVTVRGERPYPARNSRLPTTMATASKRFHRPRRRWRGDRG